MLIPKGADVIANPWAIGRDPEHFPDPETFNPQRWIDANGRLRDDLRLFSFGNGRRVCPGQHMATACVFFLLFFPSPPLPLLPPRRRRIKENE